MSTAPTPRPQADVVRIDVTTTRRHAASVLAQAVEELRRTAGRLVLAQCDYQAANELERARLASEQLGLARLGINEAEQLLETFTTQGEEQHGHEV